MNLQDDKKKKTNKQKQEKKKQNEQNVMILARFLSEMAFKFLFMWRIKTFFSYFTSG